MFILWKFTRFQVMRVRQSALWLLAVAAVVLALPGFGGIGRQANAQETSRSEEMRDDLSLDRASVLPQPSATERRIELALERPVTFDFYETPLEKLADFLRKQTGENVVVELYALQEEGVSENTPVTLALRGVPLRSALALLLNQLNLAYLIQNDVLLITSKTKAQERLSTRVYPVGDLCRQDDELRELMDVITSSIASDSWSDGGGLGTIAPYRQLACLVITQNTMVHDQIRDLLRNLRTGGGAARERREVVRLRTRLRLRGRQLKQLRTEMTRADTAAADRLAAMARRVHSLRKDLELAQKRAEFSQSGKGLREEIESDPMEQNQQR